MSSVAFPKHFTGLLCSIQAWIGERYLLIYALDIVVAQKSFGSFASCVQLLKFLSDSHVSVLENFDKYRKRNFAKFVNNVQNHAKIPRALKRRTFSRQLIIHGTMTSYTSNGTKNCSDLKFTPRKIKVERYKTTFPSFGMS